MKIFSLFGVVAVSLVSLVALAADSPEVPPQPEAAVESTEAQSAVDAAPLATPAEAGVPNLDRAVYYRVEFKNSYVFDGTPRTAVRVLNSAVDLVNSDNDFAHWDCARDGSTNPRVIEECERNSIEYDGLANRLEAEMNGKVDWSKYTVVVIGAGMYLNGDGKINIDRLVTRMEDGIEVLQVDATEGLAEEATHVETAPAQAVVIEKVLAESIELTLKKTVKVTSREE